MVESQKDYPIRLSVFEGPLDLLMHLIEKHKIDIYDIPIAEITEQYLAYIEAWREFNLEIASEFLVMAATLLQIKSRLLLPKPPKILEEDESEEDPRQALIARLIEYRKFKEIAGWLSENNEKRDQCITRLPIPLEVKTSLPQGLSLDDLIRSFLAVWESKDPQIRLIEREELTIQDKIADILSLLKRKKSALPFSEVLIRSGSRSEVVTTFLAVLELLRLKKLWLQQQAPFAEIYLTIRE